MKNFLCLIIFSISMFTFTNKVKANYEKVFYDFDIKSIDGEKIDLSIYKNKAILMVNVASNCGFTKQYTDLQKLWEEYREKGLIVLGVPSNQFGSQEPGTNEEIKEFCEVNFKIDFPLTDKTNVKGNDAHEIYLWAKKNYGKNAVPKWNIGK